MAPRKKLLHLDRLIDNPLFVPEPPKRGFSTNEEKRAWLRFAAPRSLQVLCDYILSPPKGLGPLPAFHRSRARELDADLAHGQNAVNLWTRGLWKTKTISIGQLIQRILRNPDIAILGRHFDEDIAKSIAGDTIWHFTQNPIFRYVFPEFCPPEGEEKRYSSTKSLTVPNRRFKRTEPTLLWEGLNSTTTGLHFDHLHDDDVETPKSVGREVSDAVRDKHWSRWLDWTQLAERPQAGQHRGTYSMVGTPYHYDGIILRAQERKMEFRFAFRWHPAYLVDSDHLICPEAYPRESLNRDRAALDPYEFACAILLDPVDEERAAFRITEDLYWTLPPGDYRSWRRVMSVDPAYTNRSRNDYSGIVVVDILPDDTWVLCYCSAPRLEPLSLINELIDLYRRFHPETIYIESIAAGQLLVKWLRREEERVGVRLPIYEAKYHPFRTSKEARRGEQKSARIKKLSPRVESGKLRLWKQCPNLPMLLEELRQWPLGKDEHLLDALTTLEEYAPRGPGAEEAPRVDPCRQFLADLEKDRPVGDAPEWSLQWIDQQLDEDEAELGEIGGWRRALVERRPFH